MLELINEWIARAILSGCLPTLQKSKSKTKYKTDPKQEPEDSPEQEVHTGSRAPLSLELEPCTPVLQCQVQEGSGEPCNSSSHLAFHLLGMKTLYTDNVLSAESAYKWLPETFYLICSFRNETVGTLSLLNAYGIPVITRDLLVKRKWQQLWLSTNP